MKYHHFEILRRGDGELWVLGQGSGGKTYKARDTQLARLVALKVVTADAFKTPEAKERFVAEARTAASLHHPNIASIYYFGEQDGDCFYAMEFVDGCTLEELIQREGALSAAAALDIAGQTAAALGAAHEVDLIHRDIKPANILITESSSGGRSVKLIDFGLAAGANAAAGGKAVFAGTPLFASPEQLDEVGVDARSDVYSLGAVLFFMVSGRPPYVGTLSQIVTQHTLQPTPVDLIPSAPAEVIALVKRYMKKDPNQRPRSGAQARAEAEAALRALRPDNQATAAEWLTSHFEAVSRQRPVEGGFLYRLTKSGEQADALHLDRSAAGLQAADQYRFALPKIAGLGSPCLREPGTLVEVADGLLVITKDPAPSTRLLSVMRVRRMLPLDEARIILEPLARALDEAAQAGLAIPHLGLRDIELCPALEPQTRLDRWPGLTARIDLLPITEATSINTSATIVGSTLVTASRVFSGQGADPSTVIASLAYEMLGGMTAPSSGHYVPLAELDENSNRALRGALAGELLSAVQVVTLLFGIGTLGPASLPTTKSLRLLKPGTNKSANDSTVMPSKDGTSDSRRMPHAASPEVMELFALEPAPGFLPPLLDAIGRPMTESAIHTPAEVATHLSPKPFSDNDAEHSAADLSKRGGSNVPSEQSKSGLSLAIVAFLSTLVLGWGGFVLVDSRVLGSQESLMRNYESVWKRISGAKPLQRTIEKSQRLGRAENQNSTASESGWEGESQTRMLGQASSPITYTDNSEFIDGDSTYKVKAAPSSASGRRGTVLGYAAPVPGKPGFVLSPYAPQAGFIDVRGYPPGTQVKDPYTGQTFLVP